MTEPEIGSAVPDELEVIPPKPNFHGERESAALLGCGNCGEDYDPVASRWRCPTCGWRDTCCDGAPW